MCQGFSPNTFYLKVVPMIKPVPRIIILCLLGAFIFCIIALLLFRVLKHSPELSEDKFVEVYVQLSVANEMLAPDTLKLNEEKKRIFKQSGVTQKEMDDFVNRYNQNPQGWGRVWGKIVQKLEQKLQDLK